EEAAVGREIRKARRRPGVAEAEGEDRRAARDHRDHRTDLHDRERELQLPEPAHGGEVRGAHDQQRGRHPDPLGGVREPEGRVERERGAFARHTIRISQANSHPVMYPAQGPRKRRVYSAKEPEIGIRTAISPSARSMKYTTAPPSRYTSSTE